VASPLQRIALFILKRIQFSCGICVESLALNNEAMGDDEALSGLEIAEHLCQSSNGELPSAGRSRERGGWLGASERGQMLD
jgi:hypothetical protein